MSTRLINGRRPKNKRVERALLRREPKVHENVKSAMFLRGPKTSHTINEVLSDLYTLKKPEAITFRRRNEARPFEDQTSIEFFSNKNDCSLMAYGSHQKKRPNNLILGRFFDHQVLDLIELGVENFKSIHEFEGNLSYTAGFKPMLVFRGPEFEQKEEYKKFANLLLDFFCGEAVDQVSLMGLDHVFFCTALEGKIYFRHYNVKLKKSGTSLPRVELIGIGPSMDLTIRRTRFASPDLMKEALRQPKETKVRNVKNVKQNVLGTVINVHKEKQDLSQMQTRKMKGLKRKKLDNEDGAAQDTPGADGTEGPTEAVGKKKRSQE